MAVNYGNKPFAEASEYFRQKNPLPTTGWQDVYGPQHDHAFMVAGANRTAIVEDFANSIQALIDNGGTLADFRKDFDAIVARHGWDYHGSRGWRSRLIYETNLRQAYNAGRERQFTDPDFKRQFPYMEYRHSGAENFRPQHKAWNGLVLPADDPWWDVHSPSNGYGCRCKKFPVSERQLRRMGKSGPDAAPPDAFREWVDKRTGEVRAIPLGIDPGFEHRPGESWVRALTPRHAPQGSRTVAPSIPAGPATTPPLPAPTPVNRALVLADGLPDDHYIQAFLGEFGAAGPHTFFDAMGEPLLISDALFRDSQGVLKLDKDKIRHLYVRLLARSIIDPDEIWAQLEGSASVAGKYHVKRRYIKRWELVEDGQPVHGLSVFEWVAGTWRGSTTFTPHRRSGGQRIPEKIRYLEEQRQGVLLYRRGEE